MTVFLDRQRNPLPLLLWAELYEDVDYRMVARTTWEGMTVSTVWLGTVDSGGRIFESAFADGSTETYDGFTYDVYEPFARWHTEAQAIAGHDRAVELVRTVRSDFRALMAGGGLDG